MSIRIYCSPFRLIKAGFRWLDIQENRSKLFKTFFISTPIGLFCFFGESWLQGAGLVEAVVTPFRRVVGLFAGIGLPLVAAAVFKSAPVQAVGFYYFVIRWKFKRLTHLFAPSELLDEANEDFSLIRNSFIAAKRKKFLPWPAIVARRHLELKKWLPEWSFAIVLVRDPRRFRQVAQRLLGRRTVALHVDLKDESYGIYSNEGKKHLENEYLLYRAAQETMLAAGERFLRFAESGRDGDLSWAECLPTAPPLRWASAGCLPIVYYKGRYWVALFLRDIKPVGLNVANGAAEAKEEYKDLRKLMLREFLEELTIVRSTSVSGTWEDVRMDTSRLSNEQPYRALASVFNESRELRTIQDGIRWKSDTSYSPRMVIPIETPYSVLVKWEEHDSNGIQPRQLEVKDVVYSINPLELGVEVIKPVAFRLEEHEELWDGEIHPNGFLVRRPVVLLSLDALEKSFTQFGSTAPVLSTNAKSPECRVIESLGESDIWCFQHDVDGRFSRREAIKGRPGHDAELTFLNKLIRDYDRTSSQEVLRTLCPVVWKSLDLLFHAGVNLRSDACPSSKGS